MCTPCCECCEAKEGAGDRGPEARLSSAWPFSDKSLGRIARQVSWWRRSAVAAYARRRRLVISIHGATSSDRANIVRDPDQGPSPHYLGFTGGLLRENIEVCRGVRKIVADGALPDRAGLPANQARLFKKKKLIFTSHPHGTTKSTIHIPLLTLTPFPP